MEKQKRKVAIFGAGIAGLSAAHELVTRGHEVAVYELLNEPGGFFRSSRNRENMPNEYSWHGFGPWYNNTFDIMKQIPFDQSGSVYEKALSRPIDFGIFPRQGKASFFTSLKDVLAMFQLGRVEFIRASWTMLKVWCSGMRSQEIYSQIRAFEAWKNLLSPGALENWKACFGPWIGSDWTRVSYHTAGKFFGKQLTSSVVHGHPPDEEGGPWSHGKQDGWLLLKGPSSEYWFKKWQDHLANRGASFHFGNQLIRLEALQGKATKAWIRRKGCESVEELEANDYILAINPYIAKEVLFASPGMEILPELTDFYQITQSRPHYQISFRLGFEEEVRLPRKRMAMVLADTEYNLTLFEQEQVWAKDIALGEGIRSLWTGTACVETVPGRKSKRPPLTCEAEQFKQEALKQIFESQSLKEEIKRSNQGKELSDFKLKVFEVWPEWNFSSRGLGTPWPKWVNNSSNQIHLPSQRSSLENLFFAGAHTRTQADVWSIEAAVESGRLAAQAIDPSVKVINQGAPSWMSALQQADDFLYQKGLPHVLEIGAVAVLLGLGLLLAG